MSQPLLVEAIESSFIPVLVYNNKKEDEQLLKDFNEPSWNNPVVRYLNHDAKDLIPRKDRVWATDAIAQQMIAALKANKSKVPEYLQLFESKSAKTEKAIFAMHCYWEGEGNLGQIPGVKNTRSAWLRSQEVVEVDFDPAVVDYKTLLQKAQEMKCASTVYATNPKQFETAKSLVKDKAKQIGDKETSRVAKLSDQKYYLRNSYYKFLPLSLAQSTKINAALMPGREDREKNANRFLSPRQRELLAKIKLAYKKSPESFKEIVFPEDDSKLIDYHDKLTQTLENVLK